MEEYYLKIAKKLLTTGLPDVQSCHYNPFVGSLDTVSRERLTEIKLNEGDICKARHAGPSGDNRISYGTLGLEPHEADYCSGIFIYPPGGYCGWHTNSDTQGERIYISWCKEGEKSFFRYIDTDTDEMITKYEKQGWNINRFQIIPQVPLWHCVYSDTVRFSIGFLPRTKKHACVITSKVGDWRVGETDSYLNLDNISHLLTDDRIETLQLSEIAWKGDTLDFDQLGENCYCCGGERYIRGVDLDFPPIVVRNAPNPSGKKYRMIDGKHRMMKMKELGLAHATFYVLDYAVVAVEFQLSGGSS